MKLVKRSKHYGAAVGLLGLASFLMPIAELHAQVRQAKIRLSDEAPAVSAVATSVATSTSASNSASNSAPVASVPTTLAFHRLALPLTIYSGARDGQLNDVRLRNADGEYLSYAWLGTRTEAKPQVNLLSQSLAIFPLQSSVAGQVDAAPGTESIAVDFEKGSDGALHWRGQLTPTRSKANGNQSVSTWLLDASALLRAAQVQKTQAQLVQLSLEVDSAFRGVASFELEGSTDLQHWRRLDFGGQLIQLEYRGEKIEQTEFAVPTVSLAELPYLRLRWTDAKNTPLLLKVKADAQFQQWSAPRMLWTAAIDTSKCDANMCEYDVPASMPIDSLRVRLQNTNAVANVMVFGSYETHATERRHLHHSLNPLYVLRHQKRQAAATYQQEDYLNEFRAYRLAVNGKEIENEAVPTNGYAYQKIRLRVPSGIPSLGKMPPKLELGSMERQLVFLARGSQPYRLEWGGSDQQGAAISLETLMPVAANVHQELGRAELQIEGTNTAAAMPPTQKNASASAPFSDEKKHLQWWLWLVLGAAVVILLWMVWSSLANLDQAKSDKSEHKAEPEK